MKTNTQIIPQARQENNLRQARERTGLERKQVCFLLPKKTTDELSHYERGDYLPNLKTALKLELIYKMPVRLLFPNLFADLETKIGEIKAKNRAFLPRADWFPKSAEQLKQEEYCFYAELLQSHIPNELEIKTITKHILALNNTASDYKQGRNPFADSASVRRNL